MVFNNTVTTTIAIVLGAIPTTIERSLVATTSDVYNMSNAKIQAFAKLRNWYEAIYMH